MKSLRLIVALILLNYTFACTSNKEQSSTNTTDLDSAQQIVPTDQESVQEAEIEEERARILDQRYIDDSIAYTKLAIYDGEYLISTESEGVNATLQLKYNGDQTFDYEWRLEVNSEETSCKGEMKGLLTMDQPEHGFDKIEDCFLHFDFNGYLNNAYVVVIDFEDQTKCTNLTGDCIFSGTYINKKKK